MKVIDRLTGEEVILFNKDKWLSLGWSKEQADKKERSVIISTFYTPYYYNYLDFSPFMVRTLENSGKIQGRSLTSLYSNRLRTGMYQKRPQLY